MPKRTHFNIVLIRSGLSDWDLCGRLVGQADLPLGEAGLAGVASASVALDGANLSVIMHGPDQCSIGTAEAYSRVTGAKLREVDDLADVDLGLWEGMLRSDLEEKFPKAFRRWEDEPSEVMVPEGEPIAEAQHRLVAAMGRSLEKLRSPDPGVGIVLRPMAYGLVRCWLSGVPISQLWSMADAPSYEWHELSRDRLRGAREGVGTGG
ncbi:MAG: histidine phosphatase family protein [Phycisphaerales bacterium]